MKKWVRLWLVAVLAVLGIEWVAPAAAVGGCDGRVFAVEAGTGQLVEIPSCTDTPNLGAAVEVDAADWRGYHAIFAVRDGAAAIVYAVTTTGELWWRRQEIAGDGLGSPARVGSGINWAQPVVFASRPGYLEIGARGQPIRTYRHQEWSSGGAGVSEEPYLYGPFQGPSIVGVGTSYGVGIWNGINFRIWRNHPKNMPKIDTDVWYVSGRLPDGLTGVVGNGIRLHAVNAAGEIVLLAQTGPPVELPSCPGRDARPWQTTATAPGNYLRVIVPVTLADQPSVGLPPQTVVPGCPSPSEGNPWEWQSPGI